MKFNKKAQAWKYILAGIIALVALFVIYWMLFKQSAQLKDILSKIKQIM